MNKQCGTMGNDKIHLKTIIKKLNNSRFLLCQCLHIGCAHRPVIKEVGNQDCLELIP